MLPLHHGALDSFVPVVLAARVVAASEPMPVCCASAIRRRGAVSSSLAHDPPIWVLSAYPILFLPLRAGVILPEHQTPHLCGWLSLWCRQDSNLHDCFPRSVLRNLRCPTTISPSFCVRLPFRHYTICRSFPAVVLLRASRRTARNHHTDCLCALEARKPLPSPEAYLINSLSQFDLSFYFQDRQVSLGRNVHNLIRDIILLSYPQILNIRRG